MLSRFKGHAEISTNDSSGRKFFSSKKIESCCCLVSLIQNEAYLPSNKVFIQKPQINLTVKQNNLSPIFKIISVYP